MGLPSVSVVVPTLDEGAQIGPFLDQLLAQDGLIISVVVADGGSADDTCAQALQRGVRVVHAPRGRGAQLNAGRAACGEGLLCVLHVDSAFTAPDQLARAVDHFVAEARAQSPRRLAGHFQLEFVGDPDVCAALRFFEAKSALGRAHSTNGDQGLLIEADWLDALGGFDDRLPFLEDQALGCAVAAQGRWLLLPGRLQTAARRFEVEGVRSRTTQNAVAMGLFHSGHGALLARRHDAYAAQSDAGALSVWPFVAWVAQELGRPPLRQQLQSWAAVGRYLAQDGLWHVSFAWDHHRRGAAAAHDHPALDRHDRWLAPVLARPFVGALFAPMLMLAAEVVVLWAGRHTPRGR